MPELPEVEITRRGIRRFLAGSVVDRVIVRQRALRWPVPRALERSLPGRSLDAVRRRAKYLLLGFGSGTCIVHLGMSGSLRIVPAREPYAEHDRVELRFRDGRALRLRDPRRFGAFLFTDQDPHDHPLLDGLGPEPLSGGFGGASLLRASRGRRAAIKNVLMDSRVVVGVGNIYANESLHLAGVHPRRPAGRVGAARMDRLAAAVKEVLRSAIRRGGTTLRDFSGSDGEPGYFALDLRVYGREGDPCGSCGRPIRREVIGQRSSFYCPKCQR